VRLTWTKQPYKGHRLLAATLRCRHCGRAVGDVIGYADHALERAVFVSQENGLEPGYRDGGLCCAACQGRLFLDDVESLGRHVPPDEIRGRPLSEVIREARWHERETVA